MGNTNISTANKKHITTVSNILIDKFETNANLIKLREFITQKEYEKAAQILMNYLQYYHYDYYDYFKEVKKTGESCNYLGATYWDNGNLKSTTQYNEKGAQHGEYKSWGESGILTAHKFYKNGQYYGDCKNFDEKTGELKYHVLYGEKGEPIQKYL